MFELYCTQKGCKQRQKPTLDVVSNEVICSQCGGVIEGITDFTKIGMKSIGQIKRNTGKKQAFALNCGACSNIAQPVLGDNDSLLCVRCGEEHKQVSAPFKQAILTVLKSKF